MYFKQFYLGCLAHASYLIGSDGEAAVVDPQRDVQQYIDEAAAQGLRIKYIIETHVHADFVSGHRELAERTGSAEIVFGPGAGVAFPHREVQDGDELSLGQGDQGGQVTLRMLSTPGHTPESISILVIDRVVSERPSKVLTGDTLFIGDVGRPDLVGSRGRTAAEMAGLLYDSLHHKLLTLPDDVEVYPAHGAGSLCGRHLAKETSSTIGAERQANYALQPMSREAFVRLMTTDLPEVPAYFPRDAEINRAGAPALGEIQRPLGLNPAEVTQRQNRGELVLDVRSTPAFGNAHVPGALHIGLGGQFASWAGALVPPGTPIILVADDIHGVDEAVMRLARVGIESVQGYLEGGMYAWFKAGLLTSRVAQLPVGELRNRLDGRNGFTLIDVRRPAEYAAGHVPGALNLPLALLTAELSRLDPLRPTALICGSGYRSSIGTSLLARAGFTRLYNVVGGTGAWVQAGYPTAQVQATSATPAAPEGRA
jgi:hydroxyacylglutathione hydrolase